MIYNFKNFESAEHKIGLVGIPSGEYIDVDFKEFDRVNSAGLLDYNDLVGTFVFKDKDYHKLMSFINNRMYEIQKFLKSIGLTRYKINNDHTIDTYGDVIIKIKMTKLPVKFEFVGGDFICKGIGLKVLTGCPDEVTGNFDCSKNDLEDLIDGPTVVDGNYNASNNKLNNLVGAPGKINGNFDCSYNPISDLTGGPLTISGSFDCSTCLLESLNGVPSIIGKNFDCSFNFLEDLKFGPTSIEGTYDCSYCNLKTLEGAPKSARIFICSHNKLTSMEHSPVNYQKIMYDGNPIK